MQEENQKGISYKINCNNHYVINTKMFGDKIFYSITLSKKNYDKTKMYFTRQLKFINCDPPADGDEIRIISGFEDDYFGKYDKYNAIPVICVTDYEKVEPTADAFQEYNDTIAQMDNADLPF